MPILRHFDAISQSPHLLEGIDYGTAVFIVIMCVLLFVSINTEEGMRRKLT